MIKSFDINVYNLNPNSGNNIKNISVFIHLKSIQSNSCIFNYKAHSLAIKAKMSVNSIRKYIKCFIENGWCRMDGNNLIFNKFKSFDFNKQKKIVKFQINGGCKQILKDLQLLILKTKQEQFDKYKQLRLDLFNPQDHKSYKSALKAVKKKNIDTTKLPGERDLLKLSMKKIASLLGCSIGSAHGRIKELKAAGKVFCVTGRKEVHCATYPPNVRMFLRNTSNSYYHKGFIYSVECNKYVFK